MQFYKHRNRFNSKRHNMQKKLCSTLMTFCSLSHGETVHDNHAWYLQSSADSKSLTNSLDTQQFIQYINKSTLLSERGCEGNHTFAALWAITCQFTCLALDHICEDDHVCKQRLMNEVKFDTGLPCLYNNIYFNFFELQYNFFHVIELC